MAKILHVVEGFEGGVFTLVTQICNGLVSKGHEVHLAFSLRGKTSKTPKNWHSYLESSISVSQLDMTRSVNPWQDIKSLYQIINLFRKLKPDIIHLHSSKAGFLGRIASFVTGNKNKTFYSPHGLAFLQLDYSPKKRKIFRYLEWLAARFGGKFLASSETERDYILNNICSDRNNVGLVENAIDVNLIPTKVNRNDGKVRLGIAGRITFARNPQLFAKIAKNLIKDNVEFYWVGGGNEDDVAYFKKFGVHMTGWLPTREQALDKMCELDIHLHTSLWEGMPMAVIETQVAGIPAVVTDIVGNRDIVQHGETGFVAKDENEIKIFCEKLINDPQLRIKMGNKARKLGLKRFEIERLLNDLIIIYDIN